MTELDTTTFNASTADRFAAAFNSISAGMAQVVRGRPEVIENTLLCLVSGGHILIEDVPGVGKTTLAKALAKAINSRLGRIQFTPDLLPSDVTGVSIWDRNEAKFEFRPGPVFSDLLLADEINRASPKTQSALLEAMAEGQVTVDGITHPLPDSFMVLATQNPIEQAGTFPLPESQLDRFLMRISVGYPDPNDELDILNTHQSDDVLDRLAPVATSTDVKAMSSMVSLVDFAPELRAYLVDLANATRHHPSVRLGMSPRATLSLQRVSRARAASKGRNFVVDDDIKAVAANVISHRLILHPEASLQGETGESVVERVLAGVPIPGGR